MLKYTIMFAAVAGLVFALAPAAQAGPVLVSDPGGFAPPTGLNEGDIYHLVFVSSTRRNATSTAIADYNTHVQNAANAAGIGNTVGVDWYAVCSTETVNANDNAQVSGPVYLVDPIAPILVAAQADFYTRTHLQAINQMENGQPYPGIPWSVQDPANPYQGDPDRAVWSGSYESGGKTGNFMGNPNGAAYGYSHHTGRSWLFWEHDGAKATYTKEFPLYGLSEPLEVIPEPATMALLGIGGLGLVIRRRRRT